jgi:Mn2+/Fe2+ NRAMP family transporter
VDVAVDAAVGIWLNTYDKASSKTDEIIDRDETVAHNIIGATITLGISVIMLILMAIVAGYFVAEAPSDGAFSPAIDQVESIGGTAFILLAVALLAVPVVAVVGYFINSGLGGFITTGSMRR